MSKVVITGLGVVSSNGVGKPEYYKSLKKGKLGIKKCTAFDTRKLITNFFGEVEGEFPSETTPPTEFTRLKNLMKVAVDELHIDSRLSKEKLSSFGENVWLFFGTLLATTDPIMTYGEQKEAGKSISSYLENSNDYLSWLREYLGVKGQSFVSSAACAAGTTAAGMAFDFIKNGLCEIAVVGGADPLTKVSAVGFHALKSLSQNICNPYDINRDGINIGEGAAFFTFENANHAEKRGAKIYAEVLGYGLTNDAYHITSPDPSGEGLVQAMIMSLSGTGKSVTDIDHINAHGTGTVINDETETNAVLKLFQGSDKIPTITSSKALIGHCMGASGALELAATLCALEEQTYLPLPNLKEPLNAKILLDNTKKPQIIDLAISNSLAFAGNIASLSVGKYK